MSTEADTRANYIDPALKAAGWRSENIRREFYFTDGRKLANNNRGKRCYVDYLLHKNNRFLAVIEAKKEGLPPTEGLQQAINYAQKLQVRFVYSSNGKQTYEFDLATGKGDYIEFYPTPDELESRYLSKTNKTELALRNIPFLLEGAWQPRYYQQLAVHAATDAIAHDKKRILLTLATGTGKTFIAFQIVHKLFQARWSKNGLGKRRPRVLFLADRNILADQAINTFNPYENDLIKIDGDEIRRRNGVVPTNANIFFAIYQAIAEREDIGGHYKQYDPNFFDLIIIDECHRGSANQEGSWRAILDHFSSAVHIGLTATPKRDDNVNTYEYFGTPAYVYSLKDGINDGFLTPFRVQRVHTSLDEVVLTGEDMVVNADEVEEKPKLIKVGDYDRTVVVEQRTELVAKQILRMIRPLDKTIVFCENQAHALTMRDFINKHKNNKDPHYCVRVTSDEGKVGRDLLELFQDNDKTMPVILTSSQMLTTGVDARNVRNIVLDRSIGSMVEFKQIVGRGTRVFEGKDIFTIIDFRGATQLFHDDEWDGEPDEIIEVPPITDEVNEPAGGVVDDPALPEDEQPDGVVIDDLGSDEIEPLPPKPKAIIRLGKNREIKVRDVDTYYLDENGHPLSLQEFVDKLLEQLPGLFTSVEDLQQQWADPDKREALFEQLRNVGFDGEQLVVIREMFEAEQCDLFDLLAYLAFEQPMTTRKKRADAVRQNVDFFKQYENRKAKDFMHYVLNRYEQTGEQELLRRNLPTLISLSDIGTTRDAAAAFGGNTTLVLDAFKSLQQQLYA